MVLQPVAESNSAQCVLSALAAFPPSNARVLERQADIVQGTRAGKQVEALEDKP
jgi:hypothetical protein